MSSFADTWLRRFAGLACVLAMVAMALVVALFTASIIARLAGTIVPATDDVSAILLVAVFGFGLAAAVGAGEHLSITLLIDRFAPGPRYVLGRVLEAVTLAMSLYLVYGLLHLTTSAWRSNQMMLGALPIPRYIPIGILFVSVVLFAITLALQLAKSLAAGPSKA